MPEHDTHDEDSLEELPTSRRSFIKKMALFGFAVPAVASFALDGMAYATTPILPNQPVPCELVPHQLLPNQAVRPPRPAPSPFPPQLVPNQAQPARRLL
jgi:hypothetical protein